MSHVNIQIIKSDKRAPNLPPHKYPPKMHPKIRPENKRHLCKSKLECQEAKITQVSHKPIASVKKPNQHALFIMNNIREPHQQKKSSHILGRAARSRLIVEKAYMRVIIHA